MVFHGSRSVFMVFQGSRSGFDGSRPVLMVIQGSRVVFQGSRLVFMVFYCSRSVLVGLLWFREARSKTLRIPQKILAWFVSWPHNPARPCRLWPSDDDGDGDDDHDHDLLLQSSLWSVMAFIYWLLAFSRQKHDLRIFCKHVLGVGRAG